jgi:hypothetical protein
MVLLPRHLVYVLIQICSLPASDSCRTDVITIRLRGSPLYARRYTKLRPVCMDRSLRRPVCLRSGGSMSGIQFATTTRNHPRKTSQNRSDHDQHEDNAGRKAQTDPVDASIPGNARRLLTALTSHYRWRVRQNRTDQRSEEEPHAVKVCQFERSRNLESSRSYGADPGDCPARNRPPMSIRIF